MTRGKYPVTAAWVLAVVIPVLASFVAWLWTGATTSARSCTTGEGGSTAAIIGFAVLVLSAPTVIGWYSRRARIPLGHAASAMVASALLALPLIFYSYEIWWSGHNCYT